MTKEQINDELIPRRKARRLIGAIVLSLAAVILLIVLDDKLKPADQNVDLHIPVEAVPEVAKTPSFAASAVDATPAQLAVHGMAQADAKKTFAAPRKQPVSAINPKVEDTIKVQTTVNKTPESKGLDKPVAAQLPENVVAPAASNTAPLQKNIQDAPSNRLAYENVGIGEFGDAKKINRNWKEKKLAALIDERASWFSSAIDMSSHSGTPGLSQSNFTEIPLEYKTSWHANDEVFFRADLVKLDEGSVDPASTSFGRMVLCQQPLKAACSAAPLAQQVQGAGFTVGYFGQNIRADIGVTPLEFAVTNVVGGVKYSGDFKQFGYSLEASRRPVTSSLLSWAGTRDPYNGQIWGGVVGTGGRLGVSLDKGEEFGFWSFADLRVLTGLNVINNEQLQLMAGGQFRVINEENRLLSLGLTGSYLHSAKDAGEYTFGHGGYYSPKYSRSVSLPVTYGERYPRFSYVVSGSMSVSQSQAQSAPYFPTDSASQATATALAPTNYTTPIFSSGSASTSHGYSLEGTAEYQLGRQLFVGGRLSISRSVNYAPNHALFYLRYSLAHDAAQPVFFRPKPVEPSSKF